MTRVLAGLVTAALLGLASPAAAAGTSYYFAEGTTRPGFAETLWLLNDGPSSLRVSLEYHFADGSDPVMREVDVPARTTTAVAPADDPDVGDGRDISVVLSAPARFTAARQIDVDVSFDSTGPVTGTTMLAGIAQAGTEWNLAEGSTLRGFEEYITIQNPGDVDARVSISYGFEGAAAGSSFIVVPGRTRRTITVDEEDQAGADRVGVSARVVSTNGVPILVERPVYFHRDLGDTGIATDGADVAAGALPSPSWFFAEGNVLDGWSEFLTLFNPGPGRTDVTVDYLLEDAPSQRRTYTLAAGARRTVQVYTDAPDQGVGRDATRAPSRGLSMQVSAPGAGVVAERPLYATAELGGGFVNDGHVGMGADATLACATFAMARTDGPGGSYMTLANPSDDDAVVYLDFYTGGQPISRAVSVPDRSRLTVDLSLYEPDAPPFGVDMVAPSGQVVAEAPLYFPTTGTTDLSAGLLGPTPC